MSTLSKNYKINDHFVTRCRDLTMRDGSNLRECIDIEAAVPHFCPGVVNARMHASPPRAVRCRRKKAGRCLLDALDHSGESVRKLIFCRVGSLNSGLEGPIRPWLDS
jgi:hypothetical protein